MVLIKLSDSFLISSKSNIFCSFNLLKFCKILSSEIESDHINEYDRSYSLNISTKESFNISVILIFLPNSCQLILSLYLAINSNVRY